MKKVRFLETCYLFSTGKFYNLNDEEDLTEKEAKRLHKDGVIDILIEEKIEEPTPKKPKKTTKKKASPKKEEK